MGAHYAAGGGASPLAHYLRLWRVMNNLEPAQLARRLGVPYERVYAWEGHGECPPQDLWDALGEVLRVPTAKIAALCGPAARGGRWSAHGTWWDAVGTRDAAAGRPWWWAP